MATPERVATAEFQALRRQHIDLFVVDEAHCIAQWGHDFRPAYLELREVIARLGRLPVLALTATATPDVVEDIARQLGIDRFHVVNTGIYRPNLHYEVRRTVNVEQKRRDLVDLLRDGDGTGIIYASTVKAAEEVTGFLQSHQFRVAAYHGRLAAQQLPAAARALRIGHHPRLDQLGTLPAVRQLPESDPGRRRLTRRPPAGLRLPPAGCTLLGVPRPSGYPSMDRRQFLAGTAGTAILAALRADRLEGAVQPPPDPRWDRGRLRHLLPAASDSAFLIKASFDSPVAAAALRVDGRAIPGRRNDTAGECWQFLATGLSPGRTYPLALTGPSNQILCEPWELATLPAADARPGRLRVLFFTCAGGPESDSLTRGNLPTAVRNRLLRRGLTFRPDVAVANGDHVYWDLHSARGKELETARLREFDRSAPVFGTTNETVLKRVAGPQIVPVYGTDFRSTPVFFLQDDHDHFENDEGTDAIITFPPRWFQLQLARATQQLYYPEFLAHASRPANLPWSSTSGRGDLSESFGTLRFGRLAEVLLYDVRRTMTLAGPTAVFVDPEVERWLLARTAASEVTHVVHAPSNPFGWSAGKWGEWYPDVLDPDPAARRLTTAVAKPYWQPGWLAQHDRLMQAIARMPGRVPLVVSGDLHALALGQVLRAGSQRFDANPVTTVLSGPIGTGPGGWPSVFRAIGALPPSHLDLREAVKPIEQHGFTLADFLPDRVVLRLFKWDVRNEPPEAIDRLEPFHTAELRRP